MHVGISLSEIQSVVHPCSSDFCTHQARALFGPMVAFQMRPSLPYTLAARLGCARSFVPRHILQPLQRKHVYSAPYWYSGALRCASQAKRANVAPNRVRVGGSDKQARPMNITFGTRDTRRDDQSVVSTSSKKDPKYWDAEESAQEEVRNKRMVATKKAISRYIGGNSSSAFAGCGAKLD